MDEVADGSQTSVRSIDSRQRKAPTRLRSITRRTIRRIKLDLTAMSICMVRSNSMACTSEDVRIQVNKSSSWGNWIGILTFVLPILLIVGIVIFHDAAGAGNNNQAISFGKSRARMFTGNKPAVTFGDVAGAVEAKRRACRSCRVSQVSGEVRGAWRPNSQRCACSSVHREPARRCLPEPLPAKLECRSLVFPAPNSSRCSLESAHLASAICSIKPSAIHLVSSSSTKSMPLAGSVARASAAVTTSANRP